MRQEYDVDTGIDKPDLCARWFGNTRSIAIDTSRFRVGLERKDKYIALVVVRLNSPLCYCGLGRKTMDSVDEWEKANVVCAGTT